MEEAKQSTKEEIAENTRKCWNTKCKKTAIIETNGSWRYCWKHFWLQRTGYFSRMRTVIYKNLLNL